MRLSISLVIGTAVTDAAGQAQIPYTPTASGIYTIYAVYRGRPGSSDEDNAIVGSTSILSFLEVFLCIHSSSKILLPNNITMPISELHEKEIILAADDELESVQKVINAGLNLPGWTNLNLVLSLIK